MNETDRPQRVVPELSEGIKTFCKWPLGKRIVSRAVQGLPLGPEVELVLVQGALRLASKEDIVGLLVMSGNSELEARTLYRQVASRGYVPPNSNTLETHLAQESQMKVWDVFAEPDFHLKDLAYHRFLGVEKGELAGIKGFYQREEAVEDHKEAVRVQREAENQASEANQTPETASGTATEPASGPTLPTKTI